MVKVKIWGALTSLTSGVDEIEIEATTSRELLTRLSEAYPGLKPQITRGVSLAIDGTIYRDAWFTPINPDSEVVLMPLMAGG